MQAIREIRTVEQGQIVLNLPSTLWGQQVEVIVLPISAQEAQPFRKKSLRGCLQEYARPDIDPGTEEIGDD